ncbi:hypothetical protein DENIS_2478 [Desulfonema ishimotonii]|uniref:L,D-TPase catalytic domain-containing protein n=1 Tax=Desulfonema ishimotonii TaxID=45657 RepID=A0A401FX25_9BACT|nr:L,D-transpeptidase family protein [Desulfonema ishimotonii]GBC61516.1 hypothetical protein DENIS_2478 [Desulfonema ishimotonii]
MGKRSVVHIGFFLLISLMMGATVHAARDEAADTEQYPDVFIPFDTGETPEYILVVEKSTQTLRVYEYNGKPREIHRFECSTGKSVGAKERAGDSKTPEGIYFFTRHYEDKELSPIYGVTAFTSDYPNLLDRIAGRTGSAIWLHGTNKELKPRDSNGCVALRNADLEKVAPFIRLNRTPIIITETLTPESFETKTALKSVILSLISGWVNALDRGTYHEYVGFYDSEYVPDISWWNGWNTARRQLRADKSVLAVESEKVMFFRHKEIYTVLFDLCVRYTDRRYRVGTKKLFLKQSQDRFRIIGENYQTFPDIKKAGPSDHPLMLAVNRLHQPVADEAPPAVVRDDKIENMVDGWLKAWSSKDIGRYGAFYARDFRSQGMNRAAWLKHKKQLNRKYKYIRVTKRNLVVRKGGNQMTVSFVQKYESNRLRAVGRKQLVLKREDGQWKIFRETWRKM